MEERQPSEENYLSSAGKSTKVIWVFNIILVAAIAATIFGLWYSNKNQKELASNGSVLGTTTTDPNYLVAITDNLKNNGFVLYGDAKDSKTKKQLAEFGQAANFIDYVECDSSVENNNADECVAKGIDTYPTWVHGNDKIEGLKTLAQLEKLLAGVSL